MTRTARDTVVAETEPVDSATTKLRAAFGLAVAGALLLAVGPVLGVVAGDVPPAFTAWPLLALLALAPVLLAGAFLVRGRPLVAASALAATAFFAPGGLLRDLQIVADSRYAVRPELFRPTSLAPLAAAPGLWLLVVGNVLVLAAGVLAATVGVSAGDSGDDADRSRTRRLLWLVVIAGSFAAVGLFMAPLTSTDPLVLTSGPFDSPALAMVGGVLLLIAAPVSGVVVATDAEPANRRGGLLAIAVALAALALPPLATGLFADGLGVSAGPVFVLLAALANGALAWLLGRDATADDRVAVETGAPLMVELPGQRRLHVGAGVLGLLAALAAIGGALTPQLVLPEGLAAPVDYSTRLLWPAALIVAVLSVAVSARGNVARPAFVVALAAFPLAAASALDAVLTATQIGAVQAGPGVWFTVLSVLLGTAAAITAALAGAVEREEAGVAKSQAPLPLLACVLLGALFAVGAFALPVLRAPDFAAVGLFDLRVGSWGLIATLLAVLAAAGLSLVARPPRAAALLLGAALVIAVRVLEYPLTSGRVAGAAPAAGLWLAAASAVALLIGAAVSGSRR